jgi:nucleotide-binding universal stress UspA family protein
MGPHSQHAFTYAASIATRYQATITILHVLETISDTDDIAMAQYFGNKKWHQIKKEIADDAVNFFTQHIEQFCDNAGHDRQTCPFNADDIIIRKGNPAEIILEEAQRQQVDMVVMGMKTIDDATDANDLIGETTRLVLTACCIPVLVVRSTAETRNDISSPIA